MNALSYAGSRNDAVRVNALVVMAVYGGVILLLTSCPFRGAYFKPTRSWISG